jgi:hypothetical protein
MYRSKAATVSSIRIRVPFVKLVPAKRKKMTTLHHELTRIGVQLLAA